MDPFMGYPEQMNDLQLFADHSDNYAYRDVGSGSPPASSYVAHESDGSAVAQSYVDCISPGRLQYHGNILVSQDICPEIIRNHPETGVGLESDVTIVPRKGSKRPTPQDWERWRPIITTSYKHTTAEAIMSEIRLEGFYVSEKMLRDRFRKWGVNTKIKKAAQRNSTIVQLASATANSGCPLISQIQTRIRGPIAPSSEDASQHRLLYTINSWMGDVWNRSCRSGLDITYGTSCQLINYFSDAAEIAVRTNTRIAWLALKDIGAKICQTDWLQLSPADALNILNTLTWWERVCRGSTKGILLLLKNLLLSMVGKDHPLPLVLDTLLTRELHGDDYYSISAIANSRTEAPTMSAASNDRVDFESRGLAYRCFHMSGQHAEAQTVLEAWSPSDPRFQACRLYWLALVRWKQSQYDEADRTFLSLLKTCSKSDSNYAKYVATYGQLLLEQGRTEEAQRVVLRALSMIETWVKDIATPTNLNMYWQVMCIELRDFIADSGKRDELGSVPEKIDELTIDDPS